MPQRTGLCLFLLGGLLAAGSGFAAGPGDGSGRPIEPGRIEAFLDSFFSKRISDLSVPGAVVAIVREGRVLVLKGYGVADRARRTPIDPQTTVFRVGSVSKPVTASLAARLIEEGRIDPGADVNRYLSRFQIEPSFDRPVTVADLLTHTAGFDVRLSGTAAPDEASVRPLGDYLASDLPSRVRPPGEILGYSNHGYALLGHVIENVTGRTFADAAEALLLLPLGMQHSGFRFPPEVEARAATGYEIRGGGLVPAAVIHPNIGPAAGFNTTAADMARFMIAHLEEDPAVRPGLPGLTSFASMHVRRFGADPLMPGVTFGFFEIRWNGLRALAHGGGIRGFASGLFLWPEQHLGLFVSDNGYDPELVRDLFFEFLDHGFAAAAAAVATALPPAGERRDLGGYYRLASHPRRNLEKAGALRGHDLGVTANPDGTLTLFGVRFEAISPLHYREVGGDELAAFLSDGTGRMVRLLTTDPFYGNETWERIAWYEEGRLHSTFLALFVMAFVAGLLLRPSWPAVDTEIALPSPGNRLPWGSPTDSGPGASARRAATWARRLAVAVCALDLLFVAGMFTSFRAAGEAGLLYGVPRLMRASLLFPIASVPLSLCLPWFAWIAWTEGWWRPVWRIHYSLLAVTGAAFIAFLQYWNLLGFRF